MTLIVRTYAAVLEWHSLASVWANPIPSLENATSGVCAECLDNLDCSGFDWVCDKNRVHNMINSVSVLSQ